MINKGKKEFNTISAKEEKKYLLSESNIQIITKNWVWGRGRECCCTFEGIISTASDGSCRSFSDTIGTQLVSLLGSKPGKHRTSSDGAFIALRRYLLISGVNKAEKGGRGGGDDIKLYLLTRPVLTINREWIQKKNGALQLEPLSLLLHVKGASILQANVRTEATLTN